MGEILSRPKEDNNEYSTYRILSYNVEWGFLNIPDDIKKDSCGHIIPHTDKAQQTHLTLISKNIGIVNPDICFLQEMGSIEAVEFISNKLKKLFNLDYNFKYSNGDIKGDQGIGLLIKKELVNNCTVVNIPNFTPQRALGITLTENNKVYKIVGVHLKSLYDGKIKEDEQKQCIQVQCILDWINNEKNAIICGDFNNIEESTPIKKIISAGYEDTILSEKYIPNITGNTYTEFNSSDNGKESGSRIDFIFKTEDVLLSSCHIINFERESKINNKTLRNETSDHLPMLGIFNL